MKAAIQYRKTEGEFGSYTIEEVGYCDTTEVAGVESDICTRYKLVPIPNARGVVLKVLDGTSPAIWRVTPTTLGRTYTCVKVQGMVNHFAPRQPGGTFSGKAVLTYMVRYQTVGAVS